MSIIAFTPHLKNINKTALSNPSQSLLSEGSPKTNGFKSENGSKLLEFSNANYGQLAVNNVSFTGASAKDAGLEIGLLLENLEAGGKLAVYGQFNRGTMARTLEQNHNLASSLGATRYDDLQQNGWKVYDKFVEVPTPLVFIKTMTGEVFVYPIPGTIDVGAERNISTGKANNIPLDPRKGFKIKFNNNTELNISLDSASRTSGGDKVSGKADGGKTTGSASKYLVNPDSMRVGFKDVAGIDDKIEEIKKKIIVPLHKPELYKSVGIAPPKGVLLTGPPGTGKSYTAMAIAKESGANFYSIKGSEMVSKWVGDSEANLREIFEDAKKHKPAIIFFDEIDSILTSRKGSSESAAADRLVTQFLTLMDGFESEDDNMDGVIVLGATNRPDTLDPAALRTGRFDEVIELGLPDEKGCYAIFDKISSKQHHSINDGDKQKIAAELFKLQVSASDIKNVCNKAGFHCLDRLEKSNVLNPMEEGDGWKSKLDNVVVSAEDYMRSIDELRGEKELKKRDGLSSKEKEAERMKALQEQEDMAFLRRYKLVRDDLSKILPDLLKKE